MSSCVIIIYRYTLLDNIDLEYNSHKVVMYNVFRVITQNFGSSLSLFLYQPRVSQHGESLAVFLLLKIISRYITRGFEIIRLTRLNSAVVNAEALIVGNYIFLLLSFFGEMLISLIFCVHWMQVKLRRKFLMLVSMVYNRILIK